MKLFLSLLLLLAGSAALWLYTTRSGPTYVPPEQPIVYAPAPPVLIDAPGPGEAVQVLDVEGMCCKGCTGKLYARLMDVPGVRRAAVDLKSETACVIAKADVDPGLLAQALTFEKYTARLHRTASGSAFDDSAAE